MSGEMSGDTKERSNPFEMLSDDPILNICSFLSGTDLIKLSSVDKKFKRIITETRETMHKIRLVVSFLKDDLDLDYAIKLSQSRRFTALRLDWITTFTLNDANAKDKLILLQSYMSDSVDDLVVIGHRCQELFAATIATLLPKLKKCSLHFILFDNASAPSVAGIDPQSSVTHPLESLELYATHASGVLQFFAGCKQLKEFGYDCFGVADTAKDTDLVNNFLAVQRCMEKLNYTGDGIDWNRLTCFQLTELYVNCWSNTNSHLAAANFIKKLPHLIKLDIHINRPSHRFMDVICKAPKLEKLKIQAWKDEDEDDDEDSLEGLVNHTVKEITVLFGTNITSELLQIFLGADSIFMDVGTNEQLDLSDVPLEKIEMMKPRIGCCECFNVKFNPSELPTNVEEFQSAVTKFADKFSGLISGIVIGHKTWRNRGDFKLSNSFCEGLVDLLPNIVKLRIYNIADRGKFITFLDADKGRLSLRDIKLYETFGADEPNPKKMDVQVN